MSHAPVVILQLPLSDPAALKPFVEACLRDRVALIAVWGDGCEAIEDEIDWLIVGDGTDPDRHVVTSAHPGETLDEVLDLAQAWDVEGRDGVELIRL